MEKNKKIVGFSVGAALLTAAVFVPVLKGEFLNWDDNVLFVENPFFRGFSLSNIKWMCTTFFYGHWQPLSWFSYALDYVIWDMNPYGWHFTNWVLHQINAVLVFLLCLRFAGKEAGRVRCAACLLASLFYSLHPLRVEAVAWIATRGYLLSTAFCLLAVWFYLREAERRRYPYTALLFFTLAALTKGICMMVPPVLLLIDWAFLGRMTSVRKAVICTIEKIPFFLLLLLTGVMAFLAKQTAGGMADVQHYGLGERIVQAVYGVWFYIFKSISPRQLSPLYSSLPDLSGMIISFLLTGIVAVLLFVFRKKGRAVPAVFAASFLLIFPMLGITQSGSQMFADRFTYLAAIPFSVLIAVLLVRMTRCRKLIFSSFTALLLLFGIQSAVWCRAWQDNLSLWECALAVDLDNPVAYNNAGVAFKQHGQYERALTYFNRAIQLNPGYVHAWHNRSVVSAIMGDSETACRGWDIVLSLPCVPMRDRVKILWVRGWVHAQNGNVEKALQDYNAVIEDGRATDDERAGLLLLRAKLYWEEGLLEKARSDSERVLALPDLSGARHQEANDLINKIRAMD